jgi:hypothetical protein
MADDPSNLVLEHLRHIRRTVDKIEGDMTELKSRITSFEATMGHVMAQTDGIERRLDLTPA